MTNSVDLGSAAHDQHCLHVQQLLQSTLVISNLKGPSETLRDIRSSTYQIFRIEENTNRQLNFTDEYIIRPLYLEIYIENIVEKGKNCSRGAISPLIDNILLP